MAITARTLSAAILATDTVFSLDSATGVTAPNFTTGVGITYLNCESEFMLVTALSGTVVTVQRGYGGTVAMAHGATCPVLAGGPADFGPIVPATKAYQDFFPTGSIGFSAPVASAATIAASGPLFHVTGTTATNIITPPPGMIDGGIITIIPDGVWTFTLSAVTNGIAASGTVTTALTAITFTYDAATARWYPSRIV